MILKSLQSGNRVQFKPVICLALLASLLIAMPTAATQVKILTPNSGAGETSNASHQIRLTTGQAVIGRTAPVSGQLSAELGIWASLSRTYVVSPVFDDLPGAIHQLIGNYPNPFNPSTRIRFSLAAPAEVRIDVYDLMGRRVDTLLREVKPAGNHAVTYEPRNLASGVYLVLMRADDFRATQRIMLVK